ncbi:unnamed protein product, partial [Musa textilis]
MMAAISFARLHEEKINRENHRYRSDYKQMINEPPSKEHQCKQEQPLVIELIREGLEADKVDFDNEGMNFDKDVEPITHTVHALADYSNSQTMKAEGILEHQPITVLIDTGSTNNFMDSKIADRLVYHIKDCDKFEVKIADRRPLICDSKCSKIKLFIQGQKLLWDFFLLPLEDFEMMILNG